MSAFSGQRMAMPDRVRCIQCKTFKPLHAYSSKNQNELQDLLFRAPSNWQTNERHGLVPCAECNAPRSELECNECHEAKTLDEFSKMQRKTPHTAICANCMARQLATVDITSHNASMSGVQSPFGTGASSSNGSSSWGVRPRAPAYRTSKSGFAKPPKANQTYMVPAAVTEETGFVESSGYMVAGDDCGL